MKLIRHIQAALSLLQLLCWFNFYAGSLSGQFLLQTDLSDSRRIFTLKFIRHFQTNSSISGVKYLKPLNNGTIFNIKINDFKLL